MEESESIAVSELGKPGAQQDSERFYCPFPGCNRSFAELWRLKVHFRAPPDIRGSGKERGHGTELTHCPKCNKTLKPGKHHVGCSGGKTAPRQAIKRSRVGSDNGSGGMDDDLDGPTSHPPKRKSGMAHDMDGMGFGHDAFGLPGVGGDIGMDGRADWQAATASGQPGMFPYPQPGMPYWNPDPSNPMNGFMPHPGMSGDPAQFMPPPMYPGHPGMQQQQVQGIAQQYPGFSNVMPGQVAPNYIPGGGMAPGMMMQPGAVPGVPGMPSLPGQGMGQAQQQQQQQQSQQHAMPQPATAQQQQQPQQPQQPMLGGASTSGQQQQPQQQQGAGAASGQSDGNLSDGLFDIEEFAKDFGRIPSPPPLPPDFHSASGGPSMLFNFAQFTQKLARSSSMTALDKELAAAGLELPDPGLLYDHTDDGDIMQLLFGVPDDVPTMATIHIHAHRLGDEDDTTSLGVPSSLQTSQQQPLSSSGRAFAQQIMQQPGEANGMHDAAGQGQGGMQQHHQPQQHQQHPGGLQHLADLSGGVGDGPSSSGANSKGQQPITCAQQASQVGDKLQVAKCAEPTLPGSLGQAVQEDHHQRDNLLDAETFRLLQSCD